MKMSSSRPEITLLAVIFEEKIVMVHLAKQDPIKVTTGLNSVLDTLPIRLKKVLELRFGLIDGTNPMMYKDIGLKLGVTASRSQQLVCKALRLLRYPFRIQLLCNSVPGLDFIEGTQKIRKVAPVNTDGDPSAKFKTMYVDQMDLSLRSKSTLRCADVMTVWELSQKTEADLCVYRNLGKKSVQQIKDRLAELGLTLSR